MCGGGDVGADRTVSGGLWGEISSKCSGMAI